MSGYGPYLKRAIDEQGISYEALASRLGKHSKTSVQRMTVGKREPRAREINILARELPISVERLLVEMGINLYIDETSRIPTRIRLKLAELSHEQVAVVEGMIDQLLAKGASR